MELSLLEAELKIVNTLKTMRFFTPEEQKKLWELVSELAANTAHPIAIQLTELCRELLDPEVWMLPDAYKALQEEVARVPTDMNSQELPKQL